MAHITNVGKMTFFSETSFIVRNQLGEHDSYLAKNTENSGYYLIKN